MPSTTNPTSSDSEDCPDCRAAVSPDANFCPHCGAELGGSTLPEHCPTCGDAFDADDEFCSSCGTERTDPGDEPARSSESDVDRETRRAFRRRVQRHLDAGWEIEHDHGDRVTLVDRDVGSIPVHVALFLFTGGVGNLLYGWYHYSELAETRRVSIGDGRSPPKRRESNEESTLTKLSTYALSGLLLFIGLLLVVAAAGNGTILALVFGLAFAALGLYVAPPVERRLDRRHDLTEFGRLRTVDHRIVDPIERCEESCVVCNEQFDGGVVRRRRDETVVAGIPVRTHELQCNHYCASCARDDPLSSGRELSSIGTGDTPEPSRERELDEK